MASEVFGGKTHRKAYALILKSSITSVLAAGSPGSCTNALRNRWYATWDCSHSTVADVLIHVCSQLRADGRFRLSPLSRPVNRRDHATIENMCCNAVFPHFAAIPRRFGQLPAQFTLKETES